MPHRQPTTFLGGVTRRTAGDGDIAATIRIQAYSVVRNFFRRKDCATKKTKKSRPRSEGGIAIIAAHPRCVRRLVSTNSNLAWFDGFSLGEMDGQEALLNAGADSRRIDARIEIENAAVLASFPLTMHGLSEIARHGAMAAEDQLSVLNSHIHPLLVYPGHLDFESEPVRILVKVHQGREIFHALRAFAFGWC
jgi:hypothetical protein